MGEFYTKSITNSIDFEVVLLQGTLYEMDIPFYLSQFSYVAIFILMIANGVANLPSSQLLYIVCGYFISTGSLLFIPTVIAGTLGNTIGNAITHHFSQKYGITFAQKILFIDKATFEKVHNTLSKTFKEKGIWYIFVGKLTPSIKAFIPVLAGLARTPPLPTYSLFLASSTLWAIAITSIGYYFGQHVSLKTFTIVSFAIGGSVLLIVYCKIAKTLPSQTH
jgi:membrane protein DedA with SNARE-associated domain